MVGVSDNALASGHISKALPGNRNARGAGTIRTVVEPLSLDLHSHIGFGNSSTADKRPFESSNSRGTNEAKGRFMLRSVKKLFGDKLGASDGEIGRVNDFYFDDRNWAVRYLVADTGTWMPGRLVLISPHAFGNFYQGGKVLPVNLTRKQIENSPSIESHKPVSRQYEELYYRYYGWPFYWRGDQLWGMSAFPIASVPAGRSPGEQSAEKAGKNESDDPHLRSAKAIIGYQIQASDEAIGHVTDFVLDDETWVIQHVVVDIRHWLSGKRVIIPPSQIKRISWDESKVYVDLTKEGVLGSPDFDAVAFGIREQDPRVFA